MSLRGPFSFKPPHLMTSVQSTSDFHAVCTQMDKCLKKPKTMQTYISSPKIEGYFCENAFHVRSSVLLLSLRRCPCRLYGFQHCGLSAPCTGISWVIRPVAPPPRSLGASRTVFTLFCLVPWALPPGVWPPVLFLEVSGTHPTKETSLASSHLAGTCWRR